MKNSLFLPAHTNPLGVDWQDAVCNLVFCVFVFVFNNWRAVSCHFSVITYKVKKRSGPLLSETDPRQYKIQRFLLVIFIYSLIQQIFIDHLWYAKP